MSDCNTCKIKTCILDYGTVGCDNVKEAYKQGKADAIDEVLNKINEEVDMWWNLEKENSEDDANWYTSIKMLLEELKEQAE